jgi:hypothetical protein
MSKILTALDSAWEFYSDVTGREPTPHFELDGRATIAVVQNTCGAGCGFLGLTGIEIMPEYFQILYDSVQTADQYDQVLFYEMGRNFWFYGAQLGELGSPGPGLEGPFTTGFAILNRYFSMQAAGVEGAPFRGQPFEEFNENQFQDLPRIYFADPNLDWRNTLDANVFPGEPFQLGAADLAAALTYRIFEDFGGEIYKDFWRALGTLPRAFTSEDALQNFLTAARETAGIDYSFLFKEGWSVVTGTPDADRLQVSDAGSDDRVALGFQGDDILKGGKRADTLSGGIGDDHLVGKKGADTLLGGAGDDGLDGGQGADFMVGGTGKNLVQGGPGDDIGVVSGDSAGIYDGGAGRRDHLRLDLSEQQIADASFQAELSSYQELLEHGSSNTFTFESLNGLKLRGWETVEIRGLDDGEIAGPGGVDELPPAAEVAASDPMEFFLS